MGEPHRAGLDTALLERFRAGERGALARAISLVENLAPGFEAFLHAIHPRLGGARRIGITGPPGAGKSTLATQLARRYRLEDRTVGILAVDPTSPFTGGALLGDRIRMNDLGTDAGVFIRSMATRGWLGGLAATSREVADLLDAFGFDRVMTETVGVGQSELDVAGMADSTVVVLVPESGDSIQAMKAGLMEIADIFVVNKADRRGADRLAKELESALHMRSGGSGPLGAGHHGVRRSAPPSGRAAAAQSASADAGASEEWTIPILKTVGHHGDGVDDLLSTLDRHAGYLRSSGELERRRSRRVTEGTRAAAERQLQRLTWRDGPGERMLTDALPQLLSGEESPYSVAARIVKAVTTAPRG